MDSGDGFDRLSQRVRSFYTVIEIYMFSRRSNNAYRGGKLQRKTQRQGTTTVFNDPIRGI
jgi:hypothetical protein